nr:hypothetical protein [Desulfomicrobium sp.]
LLLWAAIIPMAIANGIFRDAVLVRSLGQKRARTVSGLSLSAVILAWTILTITWVPLPGLMQYAGVGLLWLTLTVAFEFFFGRVVAKKSWQELLRAYRFENGDIWPLVLMAVAVSPVAAALLRIFP